MSERAMYARNPGNGYCSPFCHCERSAKVWFSMRELESSLAGISVVEEDGEQILHFYR
jgi:hypothetical protein